MQNLEDYGVNTASEMGYDVQDPIVQEYILQTARNLRDTTPGVSDDDIIQQGGDIVKQKFIPPKDNAPAVPPVPAQVAPGAPTAPIAPAVQSYQPVAPAYNAAREKINTQFSPEAEQAARDQNKYSKLGSELGRELGASARIASGAANAKLLDENYAETQKNLDKPFVEWQAKKASALAGLEDMLKAGRIANEDVTAQVQALGLEQALAERASKNAQISAESDPNSVTSESYRVLAKQYAPDLVQKLGDRFSTMTAAQLKTNLPALEKRYEQVLKTQKEEADRKEKIAEREFKAGESKADRESREKTSLASANATIRAAEIKAQATRDKANTPATVKASDQIASGRLEETLQKTANAEKQRLSQLETAIRDIERLENLTSGENPSVNTGPIGQYINNPFGNDVQEVNKIQKKLANQLLQEAKGAQTEGDAVRAETLTAITNMSDPTERLAAMKEELLRSRDNATQAVQNAAERVNEARAMGGRQPVQSKAPSLPVINDQASYDALPKGASYVDSNGTRAVKK